MGITAVLFDIGGTLYDCDEFDRRLAAQVESLLAARLSISVQDAATRLKNESARLSRTEGDPSKVRALANFGIGRQEVHAAFCQVEPGDFLKPDESVSSTLKRLKEESYDLAILSNFRLVLVEKILDVLRIDREAFRFCLTEDDGLPAKPSHEPFIECANRFGRQRGEIAYVGDNLQKDMIPAHDVGMRTVWVKPGAADKPLPEAVWARIGHVAELPDILKSMG